MGAKSHPSQLSARFLLLGLLIALLPSCTSFALRSKQINFKRLSPPHSISLCDEPIPLESPVVLEKLDREFTIAVWNRPQVILWLKRSGRYFPYIEQKLAEEGLPDDLKYLAVAESALITTISSNKGASGLWQLMARTGRHYGLRKNRLLDERLDFEQATDAALTHIKYLRNTFDSWALALAAYNCGEYHLKKEIRKQKVNDYYSLNLPDETERFIFRITAVKIIMENPERYGYYLPKGQLYKPFDYDTVEVKVNQQVHLNDMASALGTHYRVLKELNPHILRHELPTGKMRIRVPPEAGERVATVLREFEGRDSRGRTQVASGHYIVRPGETLSHIARKTGVPIATLKKLNRIEGSFLRAGARLLLAP
ncbi:MAG: transglycosylase SLT domain-containing protein [Syntrophobacterales bacterium]